MEIQRYVIELAYRGSAYCGWQIQPNDPSVQSMIEQKWSQLLKFPVELTGCGRTDSGVHAAQYFAHVDLPKSMLEPVPLRSLNALLPPDIAIRNAWIAPNDFHARFDAHYRKYIYRFHLHKDPFAPFNCAWFRHPSSISLDSMQSVCQVLLGTHDFRSFSKTGSQLESFVCTLYECSWVLNATGYYELHIAANRFVRGMVRLIVGMCINLAAGKISLEQIQDEFLAQKQIAKSYSVAAHGLTLESVQYPPEKWNPLLPVQFGV